MKEYFEDGLIMSGVGLALSGIGAGLILLIDPASAVHSFIGYFLGCLICAWIIQPLSKLF